jgi:hypothetical protein
MDELEMAVPEKKNSNYMLYFIVVIILSLSIIFISPEGNPINFLTGDYLAPNFEFVSAKIKNDVIFEIWLRNIGKSEAINLNYFIINEDTGKYDTSGTTIKFTIGSGQMLLAYTTLSIENSTKFDKEIMLKYNWLKNDSTSYREEKIIFRAK